MRRDRFIALTGATALAGCSGIADKLGQTGIVRGALALPEHVNFAILGAGQPLAREYRERDISPVFRPNGFMPPASPQYAHWAQDGWRGYRLTVGGLVDKPASYTLAELRGRFNRVAQITRHDCVEGWSVIGKWTGVRLGDLLAVAQPRSAARYVVFHCMDDDGSGTMYYESLTLKQAAHPQALLAYELNDKPVPVENGAPIRLKVPTQLGYKSAKYVQGIEAVAMLPGSGGYWEDQGYEWFAGI
ncbi:MAG TPA: molybdopterin-dependent oxidoreductase [Candidatus Eremiobacteraceae bacterium]|nr:molybdopterin-dependent oxidoreductase [Candidatus Eremiobacteraceae bacterium]